ncbi:MAG: ABC transporter ATP-binding protein [Gemmatimonadota bacterium]|nr:ABC transporter ATP-binding protein [Gemmatimonadota bacterium]
MTEAALSLEGVTRRFGAKAAVEALSLDVHRGELLALIGASGSGKTTTLRIIAGHEMPDEGIVRIEGRDITRLPPRSRDFGMVFQHYALFPHMTVGENVAFGLEARGVPRTERRERAARALANVGLAGADSRQVQSLSGGEQQRVALARALIIEPRLLLLDEPLSNLDPTLRRATRDELRAMLHRLGVTAVFVTHDQEDAFAVADRVALLERGRLLQVGRAEELYDRPATRAVAEFIGRAALVPARVHDGRATITFGGVSREVRVVGPEQGMPGGEALAVLRPDALEMLPAGDPDHWQGTIVERRFAGALLAYRVRLAADTEVEIHTTERGREIGDAVGVRVSREPVAIVGQ